MLEKFSRLSEQLKSKILFNHEMGDLTWFKTGGKAKVFIIVENEKELEIIINNLDGYNYFIMGVGSNLLIRDKGYNGAIIKLGKSFNELKIEEDFIQVGSSILDINLSKFAKNNSIKNLYILKTYPAGEKLIKGATAKNLFLNLLKKNKNTIYVDKENLLDKYLYKHTSHKQLIIFMGAGSISKMAYNFIKK